MSERRQKESANSLHFALALPENKEQMVWLELASSPNAF